MRSWPKAAATLSAIIAAGAWLSACRGDHAPSATDSSLAILRIGVGPFSTTSAISGVRQVTQNVSVEGLARLLQDGRVEPWLADRWTLSNGGRSLIVTLKSGATFHDGSPVDAPSVAALIREPLRNTIGPLIEDVEGVRAVDSQSFEIQFKRPSPFLMEALEVQIRKPGQTIVATGPFMVSSSPTAELHANPNYYRGKPAVDAIRVQTFPSIRSAWAELLRDRIDMLYDVGSDALDSLQSATNVAVFTYIRHYQYIVLLNAKVPALQSTAVRRALNISVDRDELTRLALSDNGVASSGVVSPSYWALPSGTRPLPFDPKRAADVLSSKHVRFTCLVPADDTFERIALHLKRQFAAVGVDVEFRATTYDDILKAEEKGAFEAILLETISGPTLLRPYQQWHSKGAVNIGGVFGNKTVDAAFEKARFAENESDYRDAVREVQQAFQDDPPAIFLAWGKRARAISRRFDVPPAEPARDILATLRLWRPRNDQRFANRN